MPTFGERSRNNLETCHEDLQKLFNEVIKHFDCSVICGHRGQEEQDKAFHNGWSKLKFPESKHNKTPALAADVVPYPVDWEAKQRFYMFVGIVRGIAAMMNIPIRCGADWDGDMEIKDQNFHDLPHFELLETT
jgi:peptidoglycan L-alanyl-D-glutamate endopeptidase CwlK